jgi:hypothetical protein
LEGSDDLTPFILEDERLLISKWGESEQNRKLLPTLEVSSVMVAKGEYTPAREEPSPSEMSTKKITARKRPMEEEEEGPRRSGRLNPKVNRVLLP